MAFKESKIILVGKGGSGKDFLRKKFESRGFKYCVSYTSRPKRGNEKEGVDYKFVSDDFFNNNVHKFYEIAEFNGWKYGRTIEDFEKSSLLIMTPGGIKNIKPEHRKKCFIIFIDVDREILKKRLAERKDGDDVERRLSADDLDFRDFKDYDVRIKNEDF
jgi:guanylate kinase